MHTIGPFSGKFFFSVGDYSTFTVGHFFVENWALIQSSQLVTLYKCWRHHSVENALNCGDPRSLSRATEKFAGHEHELNFLSKLKTQKLNEQTVIPLKA